MQRDRGQWVSWLVLLQLRSIHVYVVAVTVSIKKWGHISEATSYIHFTVYLIFLYNKNGLN